MRLVLPLMLFCASLHAERPFVIGRLMGQLGNQLFQVAATLSVALDHEADPLFPDFVDPPEPDVYNLLHNYEMLFTRLDVHWPDHEIENAYVEPSYSYQPIAYAPNMVLSGWFQSEKYFKHHKEAILSLFAVPSHRLEVLKERYAAILDHPESVSIHLRNYQREDPDHQFYAPVSRDYFEQAASLFSEDALFVVFSNDSAACRAELSSFSRDLLFIENEEYLDDFYLMSLCKHNIICNSTFSWWAAYLNPNPGKRVIAPRSWFNPAYIAWAPDLIPEEWIQLP